VTRYYLLLQFIIAFSGFSHGQTTNLNLGVPFITQYPKQVFKGGTQTWEIVQGKNGVLYFANNAGLLTFDGLHWETFPLPNQTIVRSVAIGEKGHIYAGGQDEIGFFSPDSTGALTFTSIKDQLADPSLHLSDIWDICFLGEELFFRTTQKVYKKEGTQIREVFTGEGIAMMERVEGKLWLHDKGKGLLCWEGTQFSEPFWFPAQVSQAYNIMGLCPLDGQKWLIATAKSGLFTVDETNPSTLTAFGTADVQSFAKKHQINLLQPVGSNQIALATLSGGLLIINQLGESRYLLNKQKGIQDNNVIFPYLDAQQNLWLGENYGIDHIEIGYNVQNVFPGGEQTGIAYAAQVFEDHLFLGTSNGLYIADWKDKYSAFSYPNFTLIPETEGQVWGLDQLEGHLYLGHHEGAFLWDKGQNRMRPLQTKTGVWNFKRLESHPGFAVAGTYQGLDLYRITPEGLKFLWKIEGLEESCRFLEEDPGGVLWMAHPYRGIFKIQLDATLKNLEYEIFDQQDGLPTDFRNFVFQINKAIVFGTERGIYTFDPSSNRFVAYREMGNMLDSTHAIVRLREATNGDIWYVTDRETGILRLSDVGVRKRWQKFKLPGLRSRLVGGFELLYPYNSPRAFVGAEQGFLHFDTLSHETSIPFPVRIQRVELLTKEPQLLYAGYGLAQEYKPRALSPDENSFRFTFSLPMFKKLETVQYQYYLEGLEENWSAPTVKADKEYTRLSPGVYTFHVRGVNTAGLMSKETLYRFEIMAPWYQQPLALAIYLCLLSGIVIGLIYFPRAKYEREKAHLESVHAKQDELNKARIAETKEALIRLETEKLEAEIQHKNKDLAATTMHLVQKGELIQKLRLELEQIEQQSEEIQTRKSIRRLIHLLQHDKQVDKDWERFTQHFDQVHRDFLSRLHKDYPALTPKDQKLCAYLKMNLSTKEIAPLMNISVRGVEISRYRLRKKLDLPREANLNEFMMNYAEEVVQTS